MKKLNIVVEYCECGCKCIDIKCGDVCMSYWADLRGTVYLRTHGCGTGRTVQEFKYPNGDRKLEQKAMKDAVKLGKKMVTEQAKAKITMYFLTEKKKKAKK